MPSRRTSIGVVADRIDAPMAVNGTRVGTGGSAQFFFGAVA